MAVYTGLAVNTYNFMLYLIFFFFFACIPLAVMYLKRLLVGSISLSDDSQTLGENGGTAPESKEADGGQPSGTAHILLQVLS